MCTASLAPVTVLLQICTVWCTKLRKHFNANLEVLYCFTDAIGLPGAASGCNEGKRSAVVARMQKRWLSSEATVRATSALWTIWAALKQLSENKNDAIAAVLLRLMKTKNFNMALLFCQQCHFT